MASTRRKRMANRIQQPVQVNGLYVHASPPKVVQMNPSVMRQWLRGGDLDKLEQVVLEGQGNRLVGEFSPDPKTRAFIRSCPSLLNKIDAAHAACSRGQLKELKDLIAGEKRIQLALAKDRSGVGLLHKAVFQDHGDIVEWLIQDYPSTVTMKDREGRTPLHYCGACTDAQYTWRLLLEAGADSQQTDVRGRVAAYYMDNPDDLRLPTSPADSEEIRRITAAREGLIVKPSNIRIWIHDQDLGRLKQMLWEGHGNRLRTETSKYPAVKRFLEFVPYAMNAIRDTHAAAISGDREAFVNRTESPAPVDLILSKDSNGLTPLHKAAGLGNVGVASEILRRAPRATIITDNLGRTPLHYSVLLKDQGEMYNVLIREGADELAVDNLGRTAEYYRGRPADLDTTLLRNIPEAPRTSTQLPPSWDWNVLATDGSISNQTSGASRRRRKTSRTSGPTRSDGGGSPLDAVTPNGRINGQAANDFDEDQPKTTDDVTPTGNLTSSIAENESDNGRLDSQTSSAADGEETNGSIEEEEPLEKTDGKESSEGPPQAEDGNGAAPSGLPDETPIRDQSQLDRDKLDDDVPSTTTDSREPTDSNDDGNVRASNGSGDADQSSESNELNEPLQLATEKQELKEENGTKATDETKKELTTNDGDVPGETREKRSVDDNQIDEGPGIGDISIPNIPSTADIPNPDAIPTADASSTNEIPTKEEGLSSTDLQSVNDIETGADKDASVAISKDVPSGDDIKLVVTGEDEDTSSSKLSDNQSVSDTIQSHVGEQAIPSTSQNINIPSVQVDLAPADESQDDGNDEKDPATEDTKPDGEIQVYSSDKKVPNGYITRGNDNDAGEDSANALEEIAEEVPDEAAAQQVGDSVDGEGDPVEDQSNEVGDEVQSKKYDNAEVLEENNNAATKAEDNKIDNENVDSETNEDVKGGGDDNNNDVEEMDQKTPGTPDSNDVVSGNQSSDASIDHDEDPLPDENEEAAKTKTEDPSELSTGTNTQKSIFAERTRTEAAVGSSSSGAEDEEDSGADAGAGNRPGATTDGGATSGADASPHGSSGANTQPGVGDRQGSLNTDADDKSETGENSRQDTEAENNSGADAAFGKSSGGGVGGEGGGSSNNAEEGSGESVSDEADETPRQDASQETNEDSTMQIEEEKITQEGAASEGEGFSNATTAIIGAQSSPDTINTDDLQESDSRQYRSSRRPQTPLPVSSNVLAEEDEDEGVIGDQDEEDLKRRGLVNGNETRLLQGRVIGDRNMDNQAAASNMIKGGMNGGVAGPGGTNGPPKPDPEVDRLIARGDLSALAELVLNGEGHRLVGRRSEMPELQSFIDNVPTYMAKIQSVHDSARSGQLRELQAALDRRKFAVARDPMTPAGATPLHAAVLLGQTAVVRYLAGRFPETLAARDARGRAPLHCAAALPDNGHYFNLLLNLGADRTLKDNNGRTASYYMQNPGVLTHKQLLADINAPESIADESFSDKDPLSKSIPQLGTLFNTEAGRYIAKALGDPLLLGLQELAQKRPSDPVTYLATFLYNYANRTDRDYAKQPSEPESASNMVSGGRTNENRSSVASLPPSSDDADPDSDVGKVPGIGESAFNIATRDEFGQTAIHYAAVREHSRGALLQLLADADLNVGLRDELYRTARDVALQASLPENMADIDKWVLTMAARGETDKLVELLLEGYDHILDVRESSENGIVEVAKAREQHPTVSFLNSIEDFEERRERIHTAIRMGNTAQALEMLSPSDTRSQLLAIAKNASSRCSLHLAVLHQNQDIVRHLANNFPATLVVGDNLERTALHYAMAVESVEQLSQILTSAGAKRVPKDLKGRQPSYYFMNKTDIRRLQDEENSLKINS